MELLDGDVVRTNLSKVLSFSKQDRDTNVRRIGFVCELLSRNGSGCDCCRDFALPRCSEELRARIPLFLEIYVECPIDALTQRDVKGLYKKALAGEITQFTGISDPYEPPLAPDLTIRSDQEEVLESVDRIWAMLKGRELV